jgi:hypothetical protein
MNRGINFNQKERKMKQPSKVYNYRYRTTDETGATIEISVRGPSAPTPDSFDKMIDLVKAQNPELGGDAQEVTEETQGEQPSLDSMSQREYEAYRQKEELKKSLDAQKRRGIVRLGSKRATE